MTFKHTKFQDSQIMRSLEKVAVEKGLVKPEESVKSIHKTASNNLAPSGNLTEDIIKLCAGLRADGFGKYAEEIESKFIMFKQADTLYQTSKETGEDLVDAAHPEGSHKLEGLDHKVLTIVDRKKEIEKIVNKQPIGKLATNKEILNAVKKALATDPPTVENPEDESEYAPQIKQYESAINGLKSKIQSSITLAKSLYTNLKTTTDPLLNWNIDSADNFFKSIDKLVTDIRDSDFSEVNEKLSKLYNRLKPESGVFADSGVPSADWTGVKTQVNKINAQIQKAYNFFKKAKSYKYALVELKSKEEQESATIDFESLKPLKKRTREAIALIDGYFQETSVTKLPEWKEQWAPKLSQYKKSLEDEAKLKISNIKRDPDNSDSFIENWSKNLDSTISNLKVLYQDIEKIKKEYSSRSTSPSVVAPANNPAPSLITIETVKASMKELQGLIKDNKAKINLLKDAKEKNKYNDLEGKITKWTTLSEDQLLKTFRSVYKDLQSINNALQDRIDRLQQLFGGVELADDGLISLNTLNAIKALKISLGEKASELPFKTNYQGIISINDNEYRLYDSDNKNIVSWEPVNAKITPHKNAIKFSLNIMKSIIEESSNKPTVNDNYTKFLQDINQDTSADSMDELSKIRTDFWNKFKGLGWWSDSAHKESNRAAFNTANDKAAAHIEEIKKILNYYSEHKLNSTDDNLTIRDKNNKIVKKETLDPTDKIANLSGRLNILINNVSELKKDAKYSSNKIDNLIRAMNIEKETILNIEFPSEKLTRLQEYYDKINRLYLGLLNK